MSLLENRVAIITGAGGGLGAAHAKVFAAHGCAVVVNDINYQAAEAVVEDIQAKGGRAIVNTADITDYAASKGIVEHAINEFAGLHIVVNNAGINRDKMFASMSEQDWDDIMRIHLKGHFCISSHAVRYWRDLAKAGETVDARIINTTSGAGLQGSIGQSNYAAAKAGIAALTLNQAAELGRYGITANAIAPAARTGMTMAVDAMAQQMAKPEDGSFDYWAPENVSVLLAYLASAQAAHVSGKVFESEGGRICIADGWRTTKGVDKDAQWDPNELGDVVDHMIEASTPAQKVWGS
ncbi:SDR family oxidoreductase [Thalassotalea ponticola]|uniref:SDR family oxidoreductase n=1 Tax=Thalassotalea ponticola TaxID=1523392 RepID=UPI0025B41CD7|nr:SDR family oxidoreductase [Thalassotalea ponticola]MDN3653811.1 SDR family oxidoreductase [Thalassotalea ponticola]